MSTVIIASSGEAPGKTQLRFAAKNVKSQEARLALYWAAGDIPAAAVVETVEGFPTSLPENTKGRRKKKAEETPAVTQ